MFVYGKSRIIFFPSNTLIYGISRDGSRNFIFVSTWSSVSSGYEHVKQKMYPCFQHSEQLTTFQRIKNNSAFLWFEVLRHISCKFNFHNHFSHSVLEILSILISSLCTIFCWVCFHQIKVANHKYEDLKKLFPSSFSFTWDLMLATLVGPLVNQLCKWHE